jgi:hypothetical protein
MEVVAKCHLLAGQMFSTKDIVWMRIAEEVNRHRITIKTDLSNSFNQFVSGKNFQVQVNFCEKKQEESECRGCSET